MNRTRKHHRPEFKREAVAFVVEHGQSCTAAERSLGVSGALIGRWKGELDNHDTDVFFWQGSTSAHATATP